VVDGSSFQGGVAMKRLDMLLQILMITIGAAIMGFGINAFNIANNLAEGGVAGVAVVLKLGLGLNPGLTLLVINVPLLIWGYKELESRSLCYTIYGVLVLALFLWGFESYQLPLDDILLAALFAGVSLGVGLGLVLRAGGTTGGVDIIARIFNKWFGWSFGSVMLGADVIVLCGSLVFLQLEQVMYTVVAVFVGARVVDVVLQGAYRGKAVIAISNKYDEISTAIMHEIDRGVTILNGEGAYTHEKRNVLYVVCSRSQIVRVKRIISRIDQNAFVTVSDIHEVIGQGFAKA